MARHDIPLWLLPLTVALVFLLGTNAAWALSVHAGIVPGCIPYLEGCTSISRAAREGLGNHLFRLLMLPNALAIGLHWWLSARWLSATGARGRTVLGAGLVAAVALAVYVTFLGTEGEVYRFLRRYGVVVYFGFGYLAQLALMRRAARLHALPTEVIAWMSWIAVAMLALGVANVVAGTLVTDPEEKDRWENIFEWWLGLLMVGWYAVLACGWKRRSLALDLTWRDPL